MGICYVIEYVNNVIIVEIMLIAKIKMTVVIVVFIILFCFILWSIHSRSQEEKIIRK